MSSWRKRLLAFLADDSSADYSYDDLANLLQHLGFLVRGSGGSHRTWRRALPSGIVLRVTLVDSGHGPVKRVYVKKMRSILLETPEAQQGGSDDA